LVRKASQIKLPGFPRRQIKEEEEAAVNKSKKKSTETCSAHTWRGLNQRHVGNLGLTHLCGSFAKEKKMF